jgi:replicative superfamily II helicase
VNRVPSESQYVSNSQYLEDQGLNGLTSAVEDVVHNAERLVWIAVPWFYTSSQNKWINSIIEALESKKKRGIDVRVFIRPDVSNHATVNKLNLADVKIFSKKQIIRHIHTKMVISESTLLAMTANITDFDLFRNLNTGIVTTAEKELKRAKADFNRLVEEDVLKYAEFKTTDIDKMLPHDIADFFRDQYPTLNPVQTEAMPLVLRTSENLLIGTETGTGKTLMAEVAIWNTISKNDSSKALYIAPLRAITVEKEQDWQKFAAAGLPVYKITGDEETVDEEKAKKARLILTTGEKWDSLTRKPGRFPFVRKVDLVTLDEIHIIDEETRGPTTEVLLARLRRTLPKARIIGLSATMRNIEELAHWLNGQFYKNNTYRPIPLTIAFQDIPDTRYYNISEQAKDKIVIESIQTLLAEETGTGKRGKILVFVGSRRKAEETAAKVASAIKLLDTPFLSQASNRKLRSLMEKGVAFIHAGLSANDRKMVVNAFDEGPIDVLTSTTSLAWGVNVAARTVIIRDIRIGMEKEIDFIGLKQMIGRAGRVGKENVAYAIVLVPFRERQLVETALLEGKDIESKLERYLLDHVNAEINLGVIKDERTLREWFTATFWYYQKHRIRSDWQNFLNEQLSLLVRTGFVSKDGNSLATTPLGKLTSDWYVHVKTAINLLEGLSKFDFHTYGESDRTEQYLLKLLATSEDDFAVVLRSLEEREEVQSFIESNPMFADCEAETAKVAMVLYKALRGEEFPEEEYQTVRLATQIIGYVGELGVLTHNYSAYVIARDVAKRLQYHHSRGSGQLLNLIWYSTANNEEKERNVRATYNQLMNIGVQSPRQLKESLGEESALEVSTILGENAAHAFPTINEPTVDGKHLGEDVKLIFPTLPEKTTLYCIPTGTGSDKPFTLQDSNYVSVTKTFHDFAETVGIRRFWLEVFGYNRFGWDYAKASCELLVLPNSWNLSILEELAVMVSKELPQVRSAGFLTRVIRGIKRRFSYAAYANDFVERTPVTTKAAAILARHARTPMMRLLEVGHFARKQIRIVETGKEPEPVLNMLRQKETDRFGLAVLVCSLIRSLGVSTSLVETRKHGSRGVLPICSMGERNLVLDLFDETSEGLDVRAGSKQLEVIQFQIPEILQPAEGRNLEWVEEYSGDEERQRFRVRNFTNTEYESLRNELQSVPAPVSEFPEPRRHVSSTPTQKPLAAPRAAKNLSAVGTSNVPSLRTEGKLDVRCPKCDSQLVIIRSKTSGKRFIGCLGRLERSTECDFGLPLPQSGTIALLGKRCSKCGFQLIQLKLPDRRAFASCPSCYAQSLQQRRSR